MAAEPATIRAIEASTVHQIQSGQVIVDLCSVAKELVENSLDAGATSIEVRFKNQGLDSIEVQDNGPGIAPQNYETLALKHYTSKLSSYADLDKLQTFGFRGEALSSLCALSHFSVMTCLQSEVPKGTRLEYDTSGRLKSKGVVAAQKGTTVSVESLFYNLPVRRRELERNIKREWGKVVNLLNQYACVQTGIKFTVSQQPNKGKRTILFSTKGNPTTRENISNVFGAKTMTALITLDLQLELEPTAGRPGLLSSGGSARKDKEDSGSNSTKVHICGHVSRPARGEGRQTPDRQMFYINGRPCGLPQFAKVFNEVYRSYNSTQSPFIFADIRLDTYLYDVNVSPDKRTILLHDQGQMLDNMRESLIELFEKQDVTIPISQLATAQKQQTPFRTPGPTARQSTPSSASTLMKGFRRASSIDRDVGTPLTVVSRKLSAAPPRRDEEDQAEVEEGHKPQASKADIFQMPKPSVSSRSLAKDTQSITLVSRWAERKSDARTVPRPPAQAGSGERGKNKDGTLPGNVETFLTRLRGETTEEAGEDKKDDDPMESTAIEQELMEDDREDEGQAREQEREGSIERVSGINMEPPIPAVAPPRTQGFPRPTQPTTLSRSFKRSSPEVATITIGSHTVTSVLGSSSTAKRQKVGDGSQQPGGSQRRPASGVKGKAPLPSFGGRLSQMFAASSARTMSASGSPLWAKLQAAQAVNNDAEDPEDCPQERSEESDGSQRSDEPEDDNGRLHSSEEQQEEPDVADAQSATAAHIDSEEIGDEPEPDPRLFDDDSADIPPTRSPSACCDDHVQVEDNAEEADDRDEDYTDEGEKRRKEEEKVKALIAEAEMAAAREPGDEGQKRSNLFLKGGSKRKDSTLELVQRVRVDEGLIRRRMRAWHDSLSSRAVGPGNDNGDGSNGGGPVGSGGPGIDDEAENAEEKLSLIITKSDFAKMRVVGQFNLGFVLAVREVAAGVEKDQKKRQEVEDAEDMEHDSSDSSTPSSAQTGRTSHHNRRRQRHPHPNPYPNKPSQPTEHRDDELFIIDQHASDEKYNFERLQATTVVQSQRLVRPKTLELTALEEEIMMENKAALEANGFGVEVDTSGDSPVGSRCRLLSLPLSRETTFSLADLEELVSLLADNPSGSATTVPRPSRVRSMFAMRACRSSIMVGRALSRAQMERVVRHMGGMEKPWNCPHGRPTMRHLCGLGAAWDDRVWREGHGFDGGRVDENWGVYADAGADGV